MDAKLKVSLFSKESWRKANNVLAEILEGFGECSNEIYNYII